jgi:hypothetical protein
VRPARGASLHPPESVDGANLTPTVGPARRAGANPELLGGVASLRSRADARRPGCGGARWAPAAAAAVGSCPCGGAGGRRARRVDRRRSRRPGTRAGALGRSPRSASRCGAGRGILRPVRNAAARELGDVRRHRPLCGHLGASVLGGQRSPAHPARRTDEGLLLLGTPITSIAVAALLGIGLPRLVVGMARRVLAAVVAVGCGRALPTASWR